MQYSSTCHLASACQISSQSKSNHPWRSNDVKSIFQDDGHRVRNLLLCLVLVMALVWGDGNLLARNPRVTYNYFRFRKTIRPPYLNSTAGFDFDLCVVVGMSFCISVPNLAVIWTYWRYHPRMAGCCNDVAIQPGAVRSQLSSVRRDQWCMFCTPSFAVFPTCCEQMDSNLASLEATAKTKVELE